jgi:DNA-binding response OmpR family regulator
LLPTKPKRGRRLQAIQYNRYDVVLLDLMLPGLSGTEVLKTIRFEWKLTDLPSLSFRRAAMKATHHWFGIGSGQLSPKTLQS